MTVEQAIALVVGLILPIVQAFIQRKFTLSKQQKMGLTFLLAFVVSTIVWFTGGNFSLAELSGSWFAIFSVSQGAYNILRGMTTDDNGSNSIIDKIEGTELGG